MKEIIGKKLNMTQVFLKTGEIVPATIVVCADDPGIFSEGEIVAVSGTSKGKGFQGVVKRHHFKGHPSTHGHKDQLRMPGSIGSTGLQRVIKGQRMPGRMGGGRVTVKGLKIVKVNKEDKTLSLKGALPGSRNGVVRIYGQG